MAGPIVNVAGLAQVYVQTSTGSTSYSLLGYTQDGVRLRDNAFWIDVHGDEYGGQDGPPIDIQFVGRTVNIHLELTKYDGAVADAILQRVRGNADVASHIGTLMFASGRCMPTAIICGSAAVNGAQQLLSYPYTVWREPVEVNKGTKYSTLIMDGTAYLPPAASASTGIVFTSTATSSGYITPGTTGY